MATAEISPRTGKPKRKYVRRATKGAPKTPETTTEQPTEEPKVLTNEEMAEITSRNIIPGLTEQLTAHSERINGEIKQTEEDIKDLGIRLNVLREELVTTDRTLAALK